MFEKYQKCLIFSKNSFLFCYYARWNHHKSFELPAPLAFWVIDIFQAWNQNLIMKYEPSDKKNHRWPDLKTFLLSLLTILELCIVVQVLWLSLADFSTGNSILDIYQNGFSYIFRQTKSECAMHINASHIPATEFFCVIKCHLERVKVSNNLPLSSEFLRF